ncbi:hypothetical protein ACFX2B_037562 [Malus domestica]
MPETKYAADISSIREAQAHIEPFMHKTPVLTSESLNALSGRRLFLNVNVYKRGNLCAYLYSGAFKFRGACNAVFSLDAAALSLAAKLQGIPAYVVIPKNAPKCKVENVIRYGGQIIWSEATMPSRESTAAKVLQETGALLLHPHNDRRIIRGQGTISLELLEQQVPQLDAIIVPISGWFSYM